MSDDNFVFEGNKSIFLTSRAHMVEPGDPNLELAWAENHMYQNRNYSWVLGKYVEADRANTNRQRFSFADLEAKIGCLKYGPLNVNHSSLIVGNVPASEIVFPIGGEGAAEATPLNPYVEALSVLWKARFPEVAEKVEKAHAEGLLFYSMEARPEQINCGECDKTFEYISRTDPSYCDHLNDFTASSDKNLINPDFMGNALILPPNRPGWRHAAISEVSALIETQLRENEEAFEQVKAQYSLDTATAEHMMRTLLELNRQALTR
jgi:hypothetical protein